MAFEAIIQTPWGGPWRRFVDPVAIVHADGAGAVTACLDTIEERVRRERLFAAGFVSYEAAAAFGLPVGPRAMDLPLVCFGLFRPANVSTLDALPDGCGHRAGAWQPSIDRGQYDSAIQAIKERIAGGDTYQINFTFRLGASFGGDPASLMRRLAGAQAGQWGAYVETDAHAICSASPELFFSLVDGRLTCRPMKGTARRGLYTEDDERQARRLRESEKNRAENVMVVDMVRNDLGRIARYGSVAVTSLYDVERYPAHWQMTSEVTAELDQPARPRLSRIFQALFPSGSVTGAPKHSSMGIIRALETAPRGIYTGAIGCMTPAGDAHFNVAIRTVTIDKAARRAEFGVGSGIVWDSTDRDEYAECLLKSAILTSGASRADAGAFELLETMKWTAADGYALLDRHLARLTDSARYFGVPLRREELDAALAAAVRGRTAPARVRLRVGRSGAAACDVSDLIPGPAAVRAALAPGPIDALDVFLYHKTTRRDVYDAARASRPDADVVILWNAAGEVTEATTHNVVAEIAGRKVTPPVECGLLAGTFRAELLDRGEIQIARITPDDLAAATAVWIVNSVSGWTRATMTP
ncbi:MAG TPA: aminodeoxychorismate synthase component I [Vicinamibacterales bacterium]|nr:aminodeoxychorismate synthase component I [Vicinamibacterales bacterium]